MANPRNIQTLIGRIMGEIHYLIRKDNGLNFGCLFRLSVRRNFQNKKGKYVEDIIPVKFLYGSDAQRSFAQTLEPGDGLQIVGSLWVDYYDGKANQLFVMADSVSLDDETLAKKYPDESNIIQIELPY